MNKLLEVLLVVAVVALTFGVFRLKEQNAHLRGQLEEAKDREAFAAELVSAFDKRLHACEGTQ